MARTRGSQKRASERRDASGRGAGGEGSGGAGPGPGAAIPDILRRAVTLGLSGFFMTNDALRRAVGDAVPRDWIDFATDTSERTRAEFIERLASEIARVIEGIDLVELTQRVLDGRKIEVKAQIQLLPRERGEEASAFQFSVVRGGRPK